MGRAIASGCAALLWAGTCGGAEVMVTSAGPRLHRGVTVKGIITNPNGDGPLPQRPWPWWAEPAPGPYPMPTTETLCDAAGRFSIPAVLSADDGAIHRLSVDASGYGPKPYVDVGVSNQAGGVIDLGKISLLVADEAVAGTVADADDRPMTNIVVFLHGSKAGSDSTPEDDGHRRTGPLPLRTHMQGCRRSASQCLDECAKVRVRPGPRPAGRT